MKTVKLNSFYTLTSVMFGYNIGRRLLIDCNLNKQCRYELWDYWFYQKVEQELHISSVMLTLELTSFLVLNKKLYNQIAQCKYDVNEKVKTSSYPKACHKL